MSDLDNLIAKLEQASEGSRELDAEIALAIDWHDPVGYSLREHVSTKRHTALREPGGLRHLYHWEFLRYSQSLDAALTLLPSPQANGLRCRVFIERKPTSDGTTEMWVANVRQHGEADNWTTAHTAALALTASVLRARHVDGCSRAVVTHATSSPLAWGQTDALSLRGTIWSRRRRRDNHAETPTLTHATDETGDKMSRYRKNRLIFKPKPVVIDAQQFEWKDGSGGIPDPGVKFERWHEVDTPGGHKMAPEIETAYIDTLEGKLHVSRGDWIIRGVKGERYPCKPDIFAATYEPVE